MRLRSPAAFGDGSQERERDVGRTSTPTPTTTAKTRRLVDTLERRHGLTLVLVERGVDDLAVLDLNVGRLGVMLPSQGVLHPVLVVTLED